MKPPCSASWPTERWPGPREGRGSGRGDGDAGGVRPATQDLVRQADLTAMVPDELPPADRAELELVANLVSTGAATVYRFSEASLRRATDAGRSAEQIAAYLAERATRGVPQPLDYLIRDRAPPRPDSGRHDDKLPALRRPGAARRGTSYSAAGAVGRCARSRPACWSATPSRTPWWRRCGTPASCRRRRTAPARWCCGRGRGGALSRRPGWWP